MPVIERIEDKFNTPQYHVVLDDGFTMDVGVAGFFSESLLIEQVEKRRDLHKQSGRWKGVENVSKESEGTDSSGDKRAA